MNNIEEKEKEKGKEKQVLETKKKGTKKVQEKKVSDDQREQSK